ncbi:uncharacterized protein VDAG_08206 [Verticillium dahliae VdLs.17]|uniref:Uncharacterized protein n=1 Tax=Verticillium dahliae (strain VdLs.17 / ATCC MYA-4575 / FGSC 10137) TaxID=498257 RepID=G2XDH4_VERDV|nr:uncharacterized protein VDAG_08206 [Verticillium dahliae VdLs.17]EGY17042.1 hypothetical protein VDAG_08206 [Verticillium dahliae VdLs.17]
MPQVTMEWVARVNRYLYLEENQTELAKFRPGAQFADNVSKCLKVEQMTKEGGNAAQNQEEDDKAWERRGFTLLPKGGQGGAPARLLHVPLEESHFKSAVEDLRLHKHIVRVLERGSTYMSAAELHQHFVSSSSPPLSESSAGTTTSKTSSTKNSTTSDKTTNASDAEVVYTAFFQSGMENYTGNLAFTSTFFQLKSSSCGIILGCTDDDMTRANAMLKSCETAWDHPLLLPSIFAELQRRRLRDLSEKLNNRAIWVLEELKDDIEKLSKMPDDLAVENSLKWASDLGKVQNDSNLIGEDLVSASRQLERWTSHAKALLMEDEESNKNRLHDTRRFTERFQEIGLDFQDLIASCRVNVSEAALTAEGFQNDLARRHARSNSSQAKQASLQTQASTIIAFAAMLYLPISTMASIFAMPVFDFKAAWRNLLNQPAMPSDSSDEPRPIPSTTESAAAATTRPTSQPLAAASPVVSVYLWYYLASTVALMLLTFETWYWHSHSNRPWRQRTLSFVLVIRVSQGVGKVVKTLWRHRPGGSSRKNKTKQPVLPTTQPPATVLSMSSATPQAASIGKGSCQPNVATKGSGSALLGTAPSVVQLEEPSQPQAKMGTQTPTPANVLPSGGGAAATALSPQAAATPV